ncbi:MAG: hypothetical protein U1A78_06955 [Polyangia bacterium]
MPRFNHTIDVLDLSEQIKAIIGVLNRAAAVEEIRRARAEVEGNLAGLEDETPSVIKVYRN